MTTCADGRVRKNVGQGDAIDGIPWGSKPGDRPLHPPIRVRPGSMGKPLPGTEIAVLDPDNRPAEHSQPGRLMIKLPNPQMMLGYWNDPEPLEERDHRPGRHRI